MEELKSIMEKFIASGWDIILSNFKEEGKVILYKKG